MAEYLLKRMDDTVEFSLDFFDPAETGDTLLTFLEFANELLSAEIAPIPHDAFWISWTQKLGSLNGHMAVHCERVRDPADSSTLALSIRAFGEDRGGKNIVLFNGWGRLVVGDDKHAYHDAHSETGQLLLENAFAIVKALLGALATPQAIRREVAPPEKLNRARAKKRQEPIRPLVVIDVRASQQAAAERRSEGGRTVRPHWRRGHLRRLFDGRAVPIPPCCVNMETGVAIKPEYLVRF